MKFDLEATICAIATGHQAGHRGCVRVAGWNAMEVVSRVNAIPDALTTATRARRGTLGWDLGDGFGAVEVAIWYWPTHRSYVGMPSLEIHTTGNLIILQRILEQLCRAGAQLARPGEFTLRAYLAGRMDLTQCEAVLGVIEAGSQAAFDVALQQLAGGLAIPLRRLRQQLIELLADLEAGLDFVDEDIQFISPEDLMSRLEAIRQEIERLHGSLHRRRSSGSEPVVSLVGLPNAGKSSLFNRLVGAAAAIVDSRAGTTRDYLRLPLELSSGRTLICDTAGREAANDGDGDDGVISAAAQRMTGEQTDRSDLLLYCVDPQLAPEANAAELENACRLSSTNPHRDVWWIWTKCEGSAAEEGGLPGGPPSSRIKVFATSAETGRGIAELKHAIDGWLRDREEEASGVAPSTLTRCAISIRQALDAIKAALDAAREALGDEIVAGELRIVLDNLADVAGDVPNEEVLDALFQRFCIGK